MASINTERAKQELIEAKTKLDQAYARAFMQAQDEAVRRFRYAPGKPVPTKILEQIAEAAPSVMEARQRVDSASRAFLDVRAADEAREHEPDNGPDPLVDIPHPGYENKSCREVLDAIVSESATLRDNLAQLRDIIDSDDDLSRLVWEGILENATIYGGSCTEFMEECRSILRLNKSRTALLEAKHSLDLIKDLRSEFRNLADLAKIKIRGY